MGNHDSNPIIEFQTDGQAAIVNYSVPLPGSHTGRRIILLEDVTSEDFADVQAVGVANGPIGQEHFWNDYALQTGVSLRRQAGIITDNRGNVQIDEQRFFSFCIDRFKRIGVPIETTNELTYRLLGTQPGTIARLFGAKPTLFEIPLRDGVLGPVTGEEPISGPGIRLSPPGTSTGKLPQGEYGVEFSPGPDWGAEELEIWTRGELIRIRNAVQDQVEISQRIPDATWGGGRTTTEVDVSREDPVQPQLFIIEVYGISSFLGDYGVGKTVKTFTLLPGEATTISMRTWRATKDSRTTGSSIVDSHQDTAKRTFGEQILNETTDKATQDSSFNWHVEAEAKVGFGFASAKVSGGAGGDSHSSREEFAKRVGETTEQHANEASAARETTITSSSEQSEETEQETVIERTIKNVNMRRVLNFVFRELNQQYITKTHLKDIRIAFGNGKVYREVPLSGIRTLLSEVIRPDQVDTVAQRILKLVGVVFDKDDEPVNVLEIFTMQPGGQDWDGPSDAALDPATLEFPPPTGTDAPPSFYRFKRGALSQGEDANPVQGVVIDERQIVMRTDSVIVEALLGQADALDEYAMEIQLAAAKSKTLENDKTEIILQTLRDIADVNQRAQVIIDLFKPKSNTQP